MNQTDLVGGRGESIFEVLITTWCAGRQLFLPWFLGDKHPHTDFLVELLDPPAGHPEFYVQVKSTDGRYTGRGNDRRIGIEVTKSEVGQLKQIGRPVYVVGIDVQKVRGYITAITTARRGGIRGISTRNSLSRRNLVRLHEEVAQAYARRTFCLRSSIFV